jgi:tetratricopeptide (TPR) repeat protein
VKGIGPSSYFGFSILDFRLQKPDRLADLDELKFPAKSPLKEVVIDPDHTMALAEPSPPAPLEEKISQMGWTVRDEVLEVYRQSRELKIQDGLTRFKLGLLLYDGRHYLEALEVTTQLAQSDPDWRFGAIVWQGHILDLLGRRAEAVASYQGALKVPGAQSMQHSQYNFVSDKPWVEERLKTPFERK